MVVILKIWTCADLQFYLCPSIQRQPIMQDHYCRITGGLR